QHDVTYPVTEAIVDALEVIEIKDSDHERRGVATREIEGLARELERATPVWQLGQLVLLRQLREELFLLLVRQQQIREQPDRAQARKPGCNHPAQTRTLRLEPLVLDFELALQERIAFDLPIRLESRPNRRSVRRAIRLARNLESLHVIGKVL